MPPHGRHPGGHRAERRGPSSAAGLRRPRHCPERSRPLGTAAARPGPAPGAGNQEAGSGGRGAGAGRMAGGAGPAVRGAAGTGGRRGPGRGCPGAGSARPRGWGVPLAAGLGEPCWAPQGGVPWSLATGSWVCASVWGAPGALLVFQGLRTELVAAGVKPGLWASSCQGVLWGAGSAGTSAPL